MGRGKAQQALGNAGAAGALWSSLEEYARAGCHAAKQHAQADCSRCEPAAGTMADPAAGREGARGQPGRPGWPTFLSSCTRLTTSSSSSRLCRLRCSWHRMSSESASTLNSRARWRLIPTCRCARWMTTDLRQVPGARARVCSAQVRGGQWRGLSGVGGGQGSVRCCRRGPHYACIRAPRSWSQAGEEAGRRGAADGARALRLVA